MRAINLKRLLSLRALASDPKRLLLVLVAFLLIACVKSFLPSESTIKGKVVRVIDGDTIELLTPLNESVRVRFYGIDAPESNQADGKEAKEHLASLIRGKEVMVESMQKDKYQRTLGIVWFENKDINKEMVKSGFAWAYEYYDERYSKDQEAAKKAGLGLWADKNPINPYEWRKTHSFKDKNKEK